MKILVVCDQGNNRSVTIAHHLKYWGHDVIPVGIQTNSADTLALLCEWADRIILTESKQAVEFDLNPYLHKAEAWDVGPDVYPRPFNKQLLRKVRTLMESHKDVYKAS